MPISDGYCTCATPSGIDADANLFLTHMCHSSFVMGRVTVSRKFSSRHRCNTVSNAKHTVIQAHPCAGAHLADLIKAAAGLRFSKKTLLGNLYISNHTVSSFLSDFGPNQEAAASG